MFPFRSPYRDLERAERARLEGFASPRRRATLFTRALRFGALAFIGYLGLRSGRGQLLLESARDRFPSLFERYDRWSATVIERMAERAMAEAERSPSMQRERSILSAALNVQSSQYRLEETLRTYYVRRQLPFNLTERRVFEQLKSSLGMTDEQAIDFVARLDQSGLLNELFSTRTRRQQLMKNVRLNINAERDIYEALARGRAFRQFRNELSQQFGLEGGRLDDFLRNVLTSALVNTIEMSVHRTKADTEQVMHELRRQYISALKESRLENDPIAQQLIRAGYKPITLYEALSFGYTLNDPVIAQAFRHVRPEHWRYLHLEVDYEELPAEVRRAMARYEVAMRNPNRPRDWERQVDQDPIMSLARFLVLRQPYMENITYRAYDIAGVSRREVNPEAVFTYEEDPGAPNAKGPLLKVTLDRDVLHRLQSTYTTSMLVDPDRKKIVDLTYLHPFIDLQVQRGSLFGIPVAPGVFSLQVLRMFPWFRPSHDWFIHLDPTARQPILSQAFGHDAGDPIGYDVFILGNRMFRVSAELYDRDKGVSERERQPQPGMADAPSSFGAVRAVLEEVPGEWVAMRVRGMTMRGMMNTLIASGEEPERRTWWQRWLHLGGQEHLSWFQKFAATLSPGEDDPRVVWGNFVRQVASGQRPDPNLVASVSQLMDRVMYRTDFDELAFIRALANRLESLDNRLPREGEPEYDMGRWFSALRRLAQEDDLESALGVFLRDKELEPLRYAILAAAEPESVSSFLRDEAMSFGLLAPGALKRSFRENVASDLLSNMIQMRSGLFRYIAEQYTPDRPEHLLDPIPGTLLGLPESKLRFAELLRALSLEMVMKELEVVGDADAVLSQVFQAARDVGDTRAAVWMAGALMREHLINPEVSPGFLEYAFSENIRPTEVFREALSSLGEEIVRQHSFPYVSEPLDSEDDPQARANLFVLRRGAPVGSWDWVRGYFTRWGRMEDEHDLHRYFIGWRLNEMLQPYGLGLSPSAMRSSGDIFRELAVYRFLPALGAYMAWRYINTESRMTFGYAPSDLLAETLRYGQYGLTALMDVTGITAIKKRLVSEIPGLDVYFQPRSLRELQFYHRYGLAAVRYGRGWLSGSRSALAGEGIYANLPPWYRGMRSFWQASRNADVATLQAYTRGDIPLPTLRNPLAPLFYPIRRLTGMTERAWAERHRYDRPYPVAYVHTDDVSPYALHRVTTEGVVTRVGNIGTDDLLIREGQEIPPESVRARRDYRSFMLAVGMSPRIREELVAPPGAESTVGEATGSGLPLRMAPSPVEKLRVGLRNIFHQVSEIQGIYGWLQRLGLDAFLGRENAIVTEGPDWAHSFQRRFWESLYGGLDILPWNNELNELLRRFVMKRRPTEFVYYNPLPNNMPYWVPERLRYGDPYVRIYAGELRLPGEAYRWANPARFDAPRIGPHSIRDTNLLTLSADYLGMARESQFASLSGLERAADVEMALPDKVRRRVLRRYLQGIDEETPVLMNVISQDRESAIRAHTMLMVGEGRRAELVHAFPAWADREAAELSMMERMRQLGVRRARMLLVEDTRTGEYREVSVRYNRRRLERHLREWQHTREALLQEVEAGRLNEGLFYSPLQRLEILADVAPKSPEFRRLRSLVSSQLETMTDEERERYRYALEVAERTQERYHLYPYRNVQIPTERRRFLFVDDEGNIHVEGLDTHVKLAGIRLRLGEIKKRYGLARTASAAEALDRLAEEFGLRAGREIELSYGASRGAPRAIVRVRGRELNRLLVREGLAVEDKTDTSLAARRMRQTPLRRFWNWLVDKLTHMDTPFHTKFLRVRSPLEEWERGHVFGSRAGSWESPIRSYLIPSLTSMVNKGPLGGALTGAFLGSLFGYTTGMKTELAVAGGILGASLSLARTLAFPKGYIPSRTRKRWEIDEYIDRLQYLKYMRLYQQESRLARELEGVDVEGWIQENERRVALRINQLRGKLERLQRTLSRRRDPQLLEELNRVQDELRELEEEQNATRREKRRRRGLRDRISQLFERLVRRRGAVPDVPVEGLDPSLLGEHARRALLYRAMAEQTAAGVGVAQTPGEALRTVRPYVKDIYRRILEEGTREEKRRFYDLLPDYQKLVFHDLLAPDTPLPKPQDPMRLFHRFGLPGPSWRGWDPDVDLELLRAQLVERRGLEPIDAGVYPTERAVSDVVFDEIGSPVPIRSTELVQSRLASLLGERGWQSVAGATAHSKLGGNYYIYVDYYDREYERNVYRHYARAIGSAGLA